MGYLTKFFFFFFNPTGFTEEAEEAETDGTGVNQNKSEYLLTFVASLSFLNFLYCQCLQTCV